MTSIYITGSKVFIDTGAFIAMAFKKDSKHGAAKKIFEEIGNKYPQITTNMVISEAYTFLRYEVNYHTAISFLKSVKRAEEYGYLEIIYTNRKIESKAFGLLEKFKDQDLSYTDAVSFAIILQSERIQDIFTFDHHFYITGRNIISAGP